MNSTTYNPFREALPYLQTPADHDRGGVARKEDNSVYICWALDWGLETDHKKIYLNMAAQGYVMRMLGHGSSTVESWLYKNVPDCQTFWLEDKLKCDIVQAYRWRWLNHMADQYDAGLIKL